MSLDPARLVTTPRGRRLLWHLAGEQLDPPPAWWDLETTEGPVDVDDAVLLPSLRAAVAEWDTGPPSLAELGDALAGAVDHARYWQPPSSLEHVLARPAMREALLPLASLVAALAPDWWTADIDRSAQHEVRFRWDGEAVPAPLEPATAVVDFRDETLMAAVRMARETARGHQVSGAWWSAPAGTPRTARAAGGLPSVTLALVEDELGWTHADVAPVAVPQDARVLEVHSAADWAALVARYPFEVTEARRWDWFRTTGIHARWWLPDYPALAEDVDAVHVSVAGYLDATGWAVPVPSLPGATVLAGWSPDQTVWLRHRPLPSAAAVTWRRADDAHSPWQWVSD